MKTHTIPPMKSLTPRMQTQRRLIYLSLSLSSMATRKDTTPFVRKRLLKYVETVRYITDRLMEQQEDNKDHDEHHT